MTSDKNPRASPEEKSSIDECNFNGFNWLHLTIGFRWASRPGYNARAGVSRSSSCKTCNWSKFGQHSILLWRQVSNWYVIEFFFFLWPVTIFQQSMVLTGDGRTLDDWNTLVATHPTKKRMIDCIPILKFNYCLLDHFKIWQHTNFLMWLKWRTMGPSTTLKFRLVKNMVCLLWLLFLILNNDYLLAKNFFEEFPALTYIFCGNVVTKKSHSNPPKQTVVLLLDSIRSNPRTFKYKIAGKGGKSKIKEGQHTTSILCMVSK